MNITTCFPSIYLHEKNISKHMITHDYNVGISNNKGKNHS